MNKEITTKDLRIFGLIWSAIFAFFYQNNSIGFLGLLSGVMLVLSLIQPRIFLQIKIYQTWIKIGDFIGKINGFLISFVLFFGVFSPIGIFLKLLKKDPLNRKIDLQKSSYFIDRVKQPGSMKNQF
jgi:hypothetical protein